VYVANPKRDSIAVIDSTSLAIRTVEAGDSPTYLATAPGQDVAIAINVDSRDATILRTDATGTTRTTTVPLFTSANALAMAPDGRHAIVWYDASRTKGRISAADLQAVTLVTFDAAGDKSIPLTVGFQPTAVSFSRDGASGFVVTDDGVSVARLDAVAERQVLKPVSVGASADVNARPDVSITPDGRFAIARTEGKPTVRLVDLATGAATDADLGSPVTDVDLSPDGKLAFAVLREANATVRLPIPAGFADPAARVRKEYPGETVGSAALSPDGHWAVLYTTASESERLVVEDLTTGSVASVRLRKTIKAIAFSPTSAAAIVVHRKTDGDPDAAGLALDEQLARSYGYSIVDLAKQFAKLQLAPTALGPLAFTPDGARAFVLFRDDARGIRFAQRIDLTSFFVDDLPLGSPPLAVGALPVSQRVFVSQLHPEGRITFVDWLTGASASVTGFELNGRIVE
jgi:WD40 repeat protein